MAYEIKMPQLGLTMSEGTVTKWFKQVGDAVSHGELLFEVATDKITNQIESTATGVLLEIQVAEGTLAKVQSTLAWVGEAGEKRGDVSAPSILVADEAPEQAGRAGTTEALALAAVPAAKASAVEADGWVKASPAARKMAKELNVDLSVVTGTGAGGMVTEADVIGFGWVKASPAARKAARDRGIDLAMVRPSGPEGRVVERDVLAYESTQPAVPKASPLASKLAAELAVDLNRLDKQGRIMSTDVLAAAAPQTAVPTAAISGTEKENSKPLAGIRKVISERMSASWTSAPHVHLTVEVDMTRAMELKEQLAQSSGQKASVTEIVVRCAAQVLKEIPIVNVSLAGDRIILHEQVNMGIAVALDDGLIVPVIRQAESLSLKQLREKIVDLGSRARLGKLTPDEISGGTFTITNLGMFGTDHFTPIINPPESGILAVCRTVDKPVVEKGQVVVRPMCNFVLGFDHRLIDGAVGAKFMARFRELMENPLRLLIG